MTKAEPTGYKVREKHSTFVEYEYRGMTYEVEYPNNYTYCCTSPSVQHKDAQAKIDKIIEEEGKPRKYRYEDTAEYGFNLLWNYWEGNA